MTLARSASFPGGIGDRTLIRQVVDNLLANAVKFTRSRKTALIEAEASSEEMNVYFVRDNGIGFDMDYRDKLFGVFQRLNKAKSTKERVSGSPSSNGSSTGMAGGSGRKARRAGGRRFTSRFPPPRNDTFPSMPFSYQSFTMTPRPIRFV